MRGIGVAVITSSSAPLPEPFSCSAKPLMHAESVLLVDDDQAEILEDDVLLKQRMRADQNVDAPLLERVDDLRALAAPLAPREQRDAQARGGAERADGLKMLPGEQLGRRHQRRLRSRLDRACHGEQRDHGLAAADIALEETQHALRAREVGVDLGQGTGLRAGQREGQRGEDCLAELTGCSKPPAGTPLEPRADHRQRQLIGEQLVISEPCPRRRRRQKIGFGLGRVQARKRLGERHPCLLRQKRRVRPFRQRRQVAKRLADRLAQRRIGEARGQRIDRLMQRQRRRASLSAIELGHMVGMRHLQPAVIGLELAGDQPPASLRQQPLEIGWVGVEIDELERGPRLILDQHAIGTGAAAAPLCRRPGDARSR